MTAAVTALLAAVVLLGGVAFTWARVAAGIPFVLLLPGHALMLVVDRDRRLRGLEWFTLSVATSVCVVIAAGMGLAATFRLTAVGMVVVLAAVTTLALVAAWARSAPSPEEPPNPVRRSSVGRAAFGMLALVACGLLVLLLSIPRDNRLSSPPVVQLWGLPDASGGLRLGARNVDAPSRSYRLTIQQAGKVIAQREVDLPAGTDRLFEVKKSATFTNSAPIVGVLEDESGVVASRTVSVWTE